MGWDVLPGATREDVIADCLRPYRTHTGQGRVVAYRRVENVLWTIQEFRPDFGPTDRWIGCTLLEAHGRGWGSKQMSEIEGPFQYSCPLAFLQTVPECNPGWREGVRAYHEDQQRTTV